MSALYIKLCKFLFHTIKPAFQNISAFILVRRKNKCWKKNIAVDYCGHWFLLTFLELDFTGYVIIEITSLYPKDLIRNLQLWHTLLLMGKYLSIYVILYSIHGTFECTLKNVASICQL